MKTVVKGAKNILDSFDFYESYVQKIKWSEDLFDVEIVVNYFWEDENNCKDCDIKIIFKDIRRINFDSALNISDFGGRPRCECLSYEVYEIENFVVSEIDDRLKVTISTSALEHKSFVIECLDLWVEY